ANYSGCRRTIQTGSRQFSNASRRSRIRRKSRCFLGAATRFRLGSATWRLHNSLLPRLAFRSRERRGEQTMCGNPSCTCCKRAFTEGLSLGLEVGATVGAVVGYAAGFRNGYRAGYVKGYVEGTLDIEPPAPYRRAIDLEFKRY